MSKLTEIMDRADVDQMEEEVAIQQRKEQLQKQTEKIAKVKSNLSWFEDKVIQMLVLTICAQGGTDYYELKPWMADEYERLATLLKPRLARIWEITWTK